MGSIIGGIAQGVGAYAGAQAEASAAKNAADVAQTGYRYLTSGPGAAATSNYINTGSQALTNQAGVQNQISGLLGVGGDPAASSAAFDNYKNSTGYNFQLQQGTGAINANAASTGLLDSGANAKALTGYGQNLASTTFNNYLGQLGGLNAAYGSTAQQGQNMLGTVGSVGTAAGQGAANAMLAGGQAQGNFFAGLGGAASSIASGFSGLGGSSSGTTGFGLTSGGTVAQNGAGGVGLGGGAPLTTGGDQSIMF